MTLLDVMERRGCTVERLANSMGIAPEALKGKMVENSFTIGDTQRIIEALKLTTEEVMATFFPAGRDKSVFVVQACVDVRGQAVDLFNGVYTSLEGARASLERLARAKGKALEWEGRGPLGIYGARIGAERYTVAETALHD